MTQVAILDYKARLLSAFETKETNTLEDAFDAAGLKRGTVDFGTIAPSYSIIVYEFGLVRGSPDAYYRLGKQLFNGNAILFKCDDEGNTIDFPTSVIKHMNECEEVEFFSDIAAVEAAITAGRVIRPATSINNGPPIWEWNKCYSRHATGFRQS